MQIRNALILIAALAIYSCTKSSDQETAGKSGRLTTGSIQNVAFGSCDTAGSGRGATVRVAVWQPQDSSAAAAAIRNTITEKVINRINQHGDSASIAADPAAGKSIEGAFKVFEKDYTDFKRKFSDAPGCWQVELKGDTVMVTDKVLFYQLDHISFTGGAHPNSFRSFHAFDTGTGKELDAKEFVSDSTALIHLVETHFRRKEKISDDMNLEEEGYFLKNQQFFMPANFVFTQNGVWFYYNPYEIAPYARGAVEFTIPYAELKDIMKQSEVF